MLVNSDMKSNLFKWLLIGLAFMFAASCVTPTKYGQAGGAYGNSIKEDPANKGFLLSSFNGNESTGTWSSSDYAKLGALEYCAKQSQYTLMGQPIDQSVSSTTLNAYSNSYRMKNYTHTNYNIVPVTTTYPSHTALFQCKSKLYTLEGMAESEQISREMVHAITKDFKAGVLLKEIDPKVKNSSLKTDDIIIKVNGVRIEYVTEISTALDKNIRKTTPVTIIRDSKIKTIEVNVQDSTAFLKALNQDVIARICTKNETSMTTAAKPGGPSVVASSSSSASPKNEAPDAFKTACATVSNFLNKN